MDNLVHAKKYYFLHIPKTAGTSLMKWLHGLESFSICPEKLWSGLLSTPREDLEQYTMFCGHFYRYLPLYLNEPLVTFTFLRNPFSRALSQYEHIRRSSDHYYYERVKEQGSFRAFMEDPVTQPLVKNFQVRALSAIFDPVEISRSIIRTTNKKYSLEEYLETVDPGLDDSTALLLAKEYLGKCFFVGITEKMQESVDRLSKKLSIAGKIQEPSGWLSKKLRLFTGNGVPILNTHPMGHCDVDVLSSDEWRILAGLVEADWELYQFGLQLFERSK